MALHVVSEVAAAEPVGHEAVAADDPRVLTGWVIRRPDRESEGSSSAIFLGQRWRDLQFAAELSIVRQPLLARRDALWIDGIS